MVLSHWILLDARWEGPRSGRRTLEAQRNGVPYFTSQSLGLSPLILGMKQLGTVSLRGERQPMVHDTPPWWPRASVAETCGWTWARVPAWQLTR